MPHMTAKKYTTKLKQKNSELKEDMQTCRNIDTGLKRKECPDEECTDASDRSVELKRPFVFMSAAEYNIVYAKDPPKAKQSPNTISFPCEDDDGEETLWYFKHDAAAEEVVRRHGLRTGNFVTKRTISHSVKHHPVLSLAGKMPE